MTPVVAFIVVGYHGSDVWQALTKLNVQQLTEWASLVAQLVKNPPAMQDPSLIPGLRRSAGERASYPLQYSWASLV